MGATIVIFGASGDLTKRKLGPALYNLAADGCLPEGLAVLGLAGSELSDEVFRQTMAESVREHAVELDADRWSWLQERLFYQSGDFRDPNAYERLRQRLDALEEEQGTGGNVLFYLATPPGFFGDIVDQLGRAGLTGEREGRWRRVVVEKPFGRDLESARALNARLLEALAEHQIYRIDHYLGKETVQNIFALRFSNSIFEPIWNRRYVDHVQITVAEELGVEQRAGYYEESGALRDMVPNHLLQLLALTAMEPPGSFDASKVRDEKAKLLEAIQPIEPEDVLSDAVRGQYGQGRRPEGDLEAYRSEPGVAPGSTTETYVALKLQIDNWRWVDVPFYLRTGKRLAKRLTEIAIVFKRVPFLLFRDRPASELTQNALVLRIQPEEGISLHFGAKIPGPVFRLGGVEMDFFNENYFDTSPTTGYETLLRDALNGDATLFQRADNVEAGWRVIEPVLDVWRALPPRDFANYAAGSWGPKEADLLMARDGRAWRISA